MQPNLVPITEDHSPLHPLTLNTIDETVERTVEIQEPFFFLRETRGGVDEYCRVLMCSANFPAFWWKIVCATGFHDHHGSVKWSRID